MTEALVLTAQHEAVRIITINRPDKLNALNAAVLEALGQALEAAVADASTRVIVITGTGSKAFVAGMDVEEIAGADGLAAFRAMRCGQTFFQSIARLPKPVICMANGYALGGGFELALSCDFIVASDTAKFGFPEIRLATFAGWGGTQLAMQRMAPAHAREMLWSGRYYSSAECQPFGIINRIAPAATLFEETLDFAAQFADKDPLALEFAKVATQAALPATEDRGMLIEASLYGLNFEQPHARKAFTDFLAPRPRN